MIGPDDTRADIIAPSMLAMPPTLVDMIVEEPVNRFQRRRNEAIRRRLGRWS